MSEEVWALEFIANEEHTHWEKGHRSGGLHYRTLEECISHYLKQYAYDKLYNGWDIFVRHKHTRELIPMAIFQK